MMTCWAVNYTEPSFGFVLLGILAEVTVMLFLGYFKRILLGVFCGAASGSAIAWYVLGHGSGDMVGIVRLFSTPAFGVLGGALGGLAGFLGKLIRK